MEPVRLPQSSCCLDWPGPLRGKFLFSGQILLRSPLVLASAPCSKSAVCLRRCACGSTLISFRPTIPIHCLSLKFWLLPDSKTYVTASSGTSQADKSNACYLLL